MIATLNKRILICNAQSMVIPNDAFFYPAMHLEYFWGVSI